MKKLALLFTLFCISVSAQENFKIDENGLTDFVVVSVENQTKNQLYEQALKWLKETYKSPDDVIKMNIEGEKIRFSGFKANLSCSKSGGQEVCADGVYTIELGFKDEKYLFDPVELTLSIGLNKMTFDLDNLQAFYDKKGNLIEKQRQRKENLENLFNSLSESLKNYIFSGGKSVQKEW